MATKARARRASRQDLMGCTLKQLPARRQGRAVAAAVRENGANAPVWAALVAMVGPDPTPRDQALMTTRWWGSGGVNLTVSFMERTAAALQDKILSAMNQWSQYANVQFTRVDSAGQVRISRGRGGYWSYLGTDVLQIPKGEPTMNLEGFVLATPAAEYDRVIPHEAGHTLGMAHEHLRREVVNRLDRAKTIAYFEATQGWSEADVDQQVLKPIEEASVYRRTANADEDSIMCYSLPASITKDGRPIRGGDKIDGQDAAFIASIYPKQVVVQPPPAPSVLTLEVAGATSLKVNGKAVALS